MPAITKAQAKAALTYILTHILEDDEDNALAGPIQELALKKAGIKGILDLNSLSPENIETLAYPGTDSTSPDVTLDKGDTGLIKTFCAFIFYKDSIGEPIDSNKKWLGITLEDFQHFRISKEWFAISNNPGKLSAYVPGTSGDNHSRDAITDFKRGIKRDISLFSVLKQDKQWDVW
jgi:hypothetical protein